MGQVVIGNQVKEFEFKPNGKGMVKVIITVTLPTGGDPKTTDYEFTVQ